MGPPRPDFLKGPRPLRLDRIPAPAGTRVLVFAPHPDDFDEIGITLAHLHGGGARISLLVLSSSANGVEDAFCDPPTDAAKAAVREAEQRASLAFFGLAETRLEFLRLPTAAGGYIVDDEAGFARAAERAASGSPQLVFLPHGHDTNPDHRLAAKWLGRLAADLPEKPAALFFRDPKTISMRVDAYFPFDRRAADWKSELLRFHRSQHVRNLRTRGCGLDDRILKVNAEAASEMGIPEAFAEAFEIG